MKQIEKPIVKVVNFKAMDVIATSDGNAGLAKSRNMSMGGSELFVDGVPGKL